MKYPILRPGTGRPTYICFLSSWIWNKSIRGKRTAGQVAIREVWGLG